MGNESGRLMREHGQLPLWPDQLRGLPWATIRSALFAPIRPGTRPSMQREEIATVSGYRIIFTGFRLDQADLDVYEQIFHLARAAPLGSVVEFNQREFLRDIGRNSGKTDRAWLLKSLSRLAACSLEIDTGDYAYAGSLIDEFARAKKVGTLYIRLNPRLSELFDQGWSATNALQGQALGRNQLAKWLYRFTSGLHKPLTFNLDRLSGLVNSKYGRARDFRKRLAAAAETVTSETDKTISLTWSDDGSKVTLHPNGSNPARGDSGRAPRG